MQKIAFVLACLAYARCTLQGQRSVEEKLQSLSAMMPSDRPEYGSSTVSPEKVFSVLLLALDSAVAFKHADLGAQRAQRYAPVRAARLQAGVHMIKVDLDSKKQADELGIWQRIRQRAKMADQEHADDHDQHQRGHQRHHAKNVPLLKGIREDINATISRWAQKIDANLGSSLQIFQEEVLNEWDLLANENKERQQRLRQRLRARQEAIMDSVTAMGQDLRDEIELGIGQARRGSATVERNLQELGMTWDNEVNDLIEATREDVELAFEELEEAINQKREEFAQNVKSFEVRWLEPFDQRNTSRPPRQPSFPLQLRRKEKIDAKRAELQANIDAISDELETDLKLFKRRWETTADRLQDLPVEGKNLKSLTDVRVYVAGTFFAGDVPALVRERKQQYQRLFEDGAGADPMPKFTGTGGVRPPELPTNDPLGLRKATSQKTNPVLNPTAASNLRLSNRHITIVTTASLPWMTGTSINPLLRAAYLAKAGYNITLMLPWLKKEDQLKVFPNGLTFKKPRLQEQYVRWWCAERASVSTDFLRIRWYPGQYVAFHDSVFQSIDDISSLVPPSERDAVILEEPEHLNWFHHGPRWTDTFNHVVGIGHTNYQSYARGNPNGLVKSTVAKEKFVDVMNNVVCTAYTDVCVQLSATLPNISAKSLVCNVHGVRAEFLAIGQALDPEDRDLDIYFLGKALYTKGYRKLIDALEAYKEKQALAGASVDIPHIDTYGSGPEYDSIVSEINQRQLPIQPHAGIDHAHPTMHRYKVFVNPSTSDVLCTATAEALAMGKIVIIPDHPSNTFFKQFSNTMMYQNPRELVPLLREALAREPGPMPATEAFMLSWEAASERLLDAAALPEGTRRASKGPAGTLAYGVHNIMGTQPLFDAFRTVTGRGPVIPWKKRLLPRQFSKTKAGKAEDGQQYRYIGRPVGRLGGRVRQYRKRRAKKWL